MRYGSFDLLRKRLAVSLFNDAENGALIRIPQRQCHDLCRNLPRFAGRNSAGFEQGGYPSADDAHAGLIKDASEVRETPAVCNE